MGLDVSFDDPHLTHSSPPFSECCVGFLPAEEAAILSLKYKKKKIKVHKCKKVSDNISALYGHNYGTK